MWPALSILGLLVFLLILAFLWKETPSTDWVTYEVLRRDFPRVFVGFIVVLRCIFRSRGKAFVLITIGGCGFTSIGAIWGAQLWEIVVNWLLNVIARVKVGEGFAG